MRTLPEYFASHLGKKILYNDHQYTLQKVAMFEVDGQTESGEQVVLPIDECTLVFTDYHEFLSANLPSNKFLFYDETTSRYVQRVQRLTLEQLNQKIISYICDAAGVSVGELKITKAWRKRELVEARQLHMTILKKLFNNSYASAAKIYDKYHATAFHAAKTVLNLVETDKNYFIKYADVFDILVDQFGQTAVEVFNLHNHYTFTNGRYERNLKYYLQDKRVA